MSNYIIDMNKCVGPTAADNEAARKLREAKPDLIEQFLSLHSPVRQNDDMVYEVWQDGEVTLTKGNTLWRQRSLHCIRIGVPPNLAMPVDRMPIQMNGHGSIIVRDNAVAILAANLVAEYATERRANGE